MMLSELAWLFSAAAGEPAPGTLEALVAHGLVVESDGTALRELTARGRAFVEHVCSLQLPEQVTVWRVPRIDPALLTADAPRVGALASPRPVVAVPPAIPTDPAMRRQLAKNALLAGWGRAEVAAKFEMTEHEVDVASGFAEA